MQQAKMQREIKRDKIETYVQIELTFYICDNLSLFVVIMQKVFQLSFFSLRPDTLII